MKYSHIIGLCLISTAACAEASNPASVNYVNTAIEKAFQSAVKTTTYTPGTAITIQNNVISGNYQPGTGIAISGDTISQTPTYQIGDQLDGGTIYYLDATNRHGLMVLTSSLTPEVLAHFTPDASATTPGTSAGGSAIANGIGGGNIDSQYWHSYFQQQNLMTNFTSSAVGYSLVQAPTAAGDPCPFDANTLCYGGWYLPSIRELRMLYNQKSTIPVACEQGTQLAWTSSTNVAGSVNVYTLDLTDGTAISTSINSTAPLCVLPIRQF